MAGHRRDGRRVRRLVNDAGFAGPAEPVEEVEREV